jgi:SAM-dependent methyltransferase
MRLARRGSAGPRGRRFCGQYLRPSLLTDASSPRDRIPRGLSPHAVHPRTVILAVVVIAHMTTAFRQCRKPIGRVGRVLLMQMNLTHSALTDWGLGHVDIGKSFTILDVGCGGGRTVQKLAAAASDGRVFGVDFSPESVAVSRKTNAAAIAENRVEILESSVAHLPFSDATFDLVTAVETHYYWPDLTANLGEILRVLKPGGRLVLIAEAYKGSRFSLIYQVALKLLGGKVLSRDEHRDVLTRAGFGEIDVDEQYKKSWLCAVAGRRTSSPKQDPGGGLNDAESAGAVGR